MKSFYDVLGVEPSCSPEDIKKSFRKQAKALHPDLSLGRTPDGGERLRLLLDAYQVLIDPEKRKDYDRKIKLVPGSEEFDYRSFLKQQRDDKQSQAKLIFYDLLHDRENDALELYEELLLSMEFDLDLYLDREDFMDCAFLLAEEYEKRGMFQKSFALLTTLVRFERKKPYFKHFFEEVIERLKKLITVKLPLTVSNQELLAQCFQLVEFDFSVRDTAFFLKKIAEIYLALNREDLAREYLRRGLDLYGKLPGAKKLQERIGAFQRL